MKKNFVYAIIFILASVFCAKQSMAQSGNVGAVAPDFTLKALDGREITLSQFKGKYVLLDFWGSWCKPCRKSNPLLVEMYNQFKAKKVDVEFISISVNDNDKMWKKAIEDDKLTWTQLNDSGRSIQKKYAVGGVPNYILISPEGKILYRGHPEILIPKIKEMFGI
ncbi:MAG: TlpA family protein disulfide reductase [Prevotellaceae bacterium]|jgi:peroxiredoxin|nr:TlpA family protein disulfide reductase [Prevotellaceae bacterium]